MQTTPDDPEWEMRDVDLETFKSLDPETRRLILGLLDNPTDWHHDQLAAHPNGPALAEWLLRLPAYRDAPEDDEDD